jgi:hypothetical protein
MIDLAQVGQDLQRFLDSKSWKNCIIGGLALQRWGQQRLTKDVDLTLLTGFGDEEQYVDAILQRYESRIPEGRAFFISRRVVLIKSADGIGIDVALGALPFEEGVIQRASACAYDGGFVLRTCSAEDLIVMKAVASRELDWADIESVIVRQSGKLGWQLIWKELLPLCELKEAPEIPERLKQARERIERN